MKKFSVAPILLTLSSVLMLQAPAHAGGDEWSKCAFLQNAPEKHVVVEGNTLWGISEKFLNKAWCWPKVWGQNEKNVKNPHWIYPGQTIYLEKLTGQLRLEGTPNKTANGLNGAVPTVSSEATSAFVSRTLVIEPEQLNETPRIMATRGGRVNLSRGDRAYVRGKIGEHKTFAVYRPASALKDPVTGEILGYEAKKLGSVELYRAGKAENEVHAFTVTQANDDFGIGDRLLHAPTEITTNFVPHLQAATIDARVISVPEDPAKAGENQIIPINRGKYDNIEVGSVLTLFREGLIVEDPTDEKKPVKLTDEEYGTLLIFRVFNKVSYGIVMDASDTVQIGDIVRSPD